MTTRETLISKYGNPLLGSTEAKMFEVKWMQVWECQKDFPALPFKRMYVHKLLIQHLQKVFQKLKDENLLSEIKTFDGCFNPRYIRGYEKEKIASFHSWSVAVDLNASHNPLGHSRAQAIAKGLLPFTEQFIHAWRACGFTCGADFVRADIMHFQMTNI